MAKKIIRNLAIIPARINSKRIPQKNAVSLGGYPLFWHTVNAALLATEIDAVLLTTESPGLIRMAKDLLFKEYRGSGFTTGELAKDFAKIRTNHGAVYLLKRNPKLSQDFVQVSEVTLDALRTMQLNDFDVQNVIILQPTSPFRSSEMIDEGIRLFMDVYNRKGTLFTAFKDNGFHWRLSNKDYSIPALPLGHDPEHRLGGQWEYQDYTIVRENGAMYILGAETFSLQTTMRVPPFHAFVVEDDIEIDTLDDLELAKKRIGDGEHD